MPDVGVVEARPDARRARAWIDFGVDGSWEPAPARSRSRARTAAPRPTSDARASVRSHEPRGATAQTRAARAAGAPRSAREPRPVRAITPIAPSRRPARPAAVAHTGGGAAGAAPRRVEAPMHGFDTASFAVVTSPPARRTVQIRGRGAEGYAWSSATSGRRTGAPLGRRASSPDRMALWAVLLGVLLVLVAATSSHAATLRHGVAVRPAVAAPHVRVLAAPRAPRP